MVASLLRNPKVTVYVDDARRWLTRNPGARFDVVLMNTSFHWRAHATNLLSVEFLKMIRTHLKPGGVHYYNTTHSPEALRTGCTVFPHALRVAGFLVASDSPILLDRERWRASLLEFRIDGKPVLDPARHEWRVKELLQWIDSVNDPDGSKPMRIEPRASILRRTAGARLVTDDNMATEWTRPGAHP
jgi:spermidine synthase